MPLIILEIGGIFSVRSFREMFSDSLFSALSSTTSASESAEDEESEALTANLERDWRL